MPSNEQEHALSRPRRSHIAGGAAQVLQDAIATAERELFGQASPPRPSAIAAFERVLLSTAAWALASVYEASPPRTTAQSRARLFRRACEVIDARLAEGLTMSELCSSVGASRRTLEQAFMEALGASPYQYVRALRLNAIRREVLAEENVGASISDIAARYGVWRLARFAAEYKEKFGELPSESRLSRPVSHLLG